jgi:hypothetical protein
MVISAARQKQIITRWRRGFIAAKTLCADDCAWERRINRKSLFAW